LFEQPSDHWSAGFHRLKSPNENEISHGRVCWQTR
jgi:hypothetical protein